MLGRSLRKCFPVRPNVPYSLWILVTLVVASLSFLIFSLARSVNGEEGPVVRLSNGNLIGFMQTIQDKPIYTYLNVPYAWPANEFRFLPPQPDDRPWLEDRVAKSYGPGCPIPDLQISLEEIEYSEDCLQLNVWTPVLFNRTNPPNSEQLRPVFVFIHGGALLFGSAADAKSFDGAFLASLGDLVVVTINYRLGILGFLYDGEEIRGNLGLLDQRLALLWVRENIERFGGDPNKITLAGESAGSWSVGVHLLLEKENELVRFHRAMMMSGTPLQLSNSKVVASNSIDLILFAQPVLEESEERASKKFALVLKRTNCKDLACLQKVPLKELLALNFDQKIINLSPNIFRLAFQPVYGPKNGLLSKSTFEQLADKDHRVRSVNLLFGNLVNEGQDAWTFWKLSFPVPAKEPSRSRENYVETLQNFLRSTTDLSQIDRSSLVKNINKFYFDQEMPDLELGLRSSFYRALGDLVFICPSKFFAKSYFRKTQTKALFEYQITYASLNAGTKDFDPTCEEDKFGPCHTLDLQYLFGRPFRLASQYSANDRTLSLDMIKLVQHFASTGQANWRPYFKMNVRRSNELIVPTKFELNPSNGNKEHTGTEQLSCTMLESYFYDRNKPF